MANKGELTIFTQLKEILKSDVKTYFVLWKHAPSFLPSKESINTFDELINTYKVFKDYTEDFCNKWLIESTTQTACKWLLNKTHQIRMIELYNDYFEKAKTDVQSFKAFTDFADKFFATEKDSELLAILNGISEEDLIE